MCQRIRHDSDTTQTLHFTYRFVRESLNRFKNIIKSYADSTLSLANIFYFIARKHAKLAAKVSRNHSSTIFLLCGFLWYMYMYNINYDYSQYFFIQLAKAEIFTIIIFQARKNLRNTNIRNVFDLIRIDDLILSVHKSITQWLDFKKSYKTYPNLQSDL